MQKHNARRFTSLAATALALATAAAGLVWADVLTIQDDNGETRTCNYTDISIDPSDGSAMIEVTDLESDACGGSSGGTNTAPNADFTFSCTDLTCSFDASASSDPDGDPLSFDWDFGDQTTGTGEKTQHTYAVEGNFSVELTVDDSLASDTISRPVSVSIGGTGSCGGDRAPPQNMQRAVNCAINDSTIDCRSYADIFNGIPGSTVIRRLRFTPGQYLAMRFDPATIPPDAQLRIGVSAAQTGSTTLGQPIWSVSTCPGDFNETAIVNELGDSDCITGGTSARAGFSIGGANAVSSLELRCGLSLAPGTVYYINMLFTDDPVGTPNSELSWDCFGSTECGGQYQPGNISGW